MAENVFISWSGSTSRALAEALHEWLSSVIQAIKPWLSSADIEKGAQWPREIFEKLKEIKIGIICLTQDNLDAHWLLFEAGALSKALEQTRVCTYLFGLDPADVKPPLGLFQSTKAEKSDTRQLLASINNALGESGLSNEQLRDSFEIWWPKLDARLKEISAKPVKGPVPPKRKDREILEEILEIVRSQARQTDQSDARFTRLKEALKRPAADRAVLADLGQFPQVETLSSFAETVKELSTLSDLQASATTKALRHYLQLINESPSRPRENNLGPKEKD